MQYFSSVLTKMLLCMLGTESTSLAFILENVPFAAGENENSPNPHANFHGNMGLFLKDITK